MTAVDLTWLRLHFSADLDVDAVRAFLLNLITDRQSRHLVFEVESGRGEPVWRIGTSNPRLIYRLTKTHLPSATVARQDRSVPSALSAWRLRCNDYGRPLNVSNPETATASFLGALAVAGKASTIHQLVIGKRLTPQVVPKKLTAIPGNRPASRAVNALLTGSRPMDPETRRALVNKTSSPGAQVSIRLGIHDPEHSYQQLPAGYMAAWRGLAAPGQHFHLKPIPSRHLTNANPNRRHTISLNIDELLAVLAWPYGQRSYPRLDRDRSITLPLPRSSSAGKTLGTSTHPGHTNQELNLSPRDATRHLVALGPTGVGKSTLLANLALHDIAANRSVVVIDPKGDLVDDILARVPNDHLHRVVVLDPSRTDFIVGFNPLAVNTSQRHQAIDQLLHIFKNLYANSWGPRSQDILHASLLTVAGTDHNHLTAVPRLLTDPAFRHQLLQRPMSHELASFWTWFDQLSTAERSTVIAPVLNKLRPFTLRPNLAAVLSAPEPFQLKRIFTERLVLLVPLRKGQLGPEVAHLFGSMLMASLWQTIQSRAAIDPARRHPSFIYADEFQDYLRLPLDFADVLAQSRGLGVGLTLAHQNLDQLPTDLRRSVYSNAQNKVYFRLSADDASLIARHIESLRPTDLSRLPRFEAYASILHNDDLLPFASIRTRPLSAALRDHRQAAKQIAERWGSRPLAPEVSQQHRPPEASEPVGRRRRQP